MYCPDKLLFCCYCKVYQVGPGAVSVVTSRQVVYAVSRKWEGGSFNPQAKEFRIFWFRTATYNLRML